MDRPYIKNNNFIMKDTKTNKPVVVSHFQGSDSELEAHNFSEFLKEQFIQPIEKEDPYPNVTLH